MAVAENAGVKVDSSSQNSVAETKPQQCPDEQNPKSDSSIETSNLPINDSIPETDDQNNEISQKDQTQTPIGFNKKGLESKSENEIRELVDAFSKLNPMAEEFVPNFLPRSHHQSRDLGNGLGLMNNFTVQPVLGDGNDRSGRRPQRRNFGQGKRRMNKRTSLAQKEDVIKRTVYVSDIDQQITEEHLASFFLNCGQVVDCRVCGDPNSVLRFAFIEFTDEEGAKSAISLSGTVLGFYPLKVLPSKTAIAPVNPTFLPRSEDEREMCVRTVYCTNIDKQITQNDLKEFFERLCGEVQRLRLGDYHHQTRIAFVEFAMAESAIAALHCSGVVFGSLPIRVSPSKTPVRPHIPRGEYN